MEYIREEEVVEKYFNLLIFSERSLAVCVSCQMVKCYGETASGRLAKICSFLGDQPSCSSVTLRALLVHL